MKYRVLASMTAARVTRVSDLEALRNPCPMPRGMRDGAAWTADLGAVARSLGVSRFRLFWATRRGPALFPINL